VYAAEVMDEHLGSYLNDFLKESWTDLGWSLDKYFEEIKYDMSAVDPRSLITDFITQPKEISTRYNLEEILQRKNGMKAWRESLLV
jgi:hypothetical protein